MAIYKDCSIAQLENELESAFDQVQTIIEIDVQNKEGQKL